jgi:putative sporulation protein YtxC
LALITLCLQDAEEVRYLLEQLKNHGHFYQQVISERLNVSVAVKEGREREGIEFLKGQVKKIILEKNRIAYWTRVLARDFFFLDPLERRQIIEMAEMILKGKRKDVPVKVALSEEEKLIEETLDEWLANRQPLSLKALAAFRLKDYFKKLDLLIETAIDEYKLEQEYQSFIQCLREYLNGRTPKMEKIYLSHDEGFRLFDGEGRELKRSDLQRLLDRKLLVNFPVYVDSMILAPLLSIAPERILLFTADPEQGIVQTIKSIFEEKLTVYPLSAFLLLKGKDFT